MPIIIDRISSPLDSVTEEITEKARKLCRIPKDSIRTIDIHRTSLDARRQDNIHFVHSVYAELYDVKAEKALCRKYKYCRFCEPVGSLVVPEITNNNKNGRVVIAGFGPAGMFCALLLARCGYRPLVLEKGTDADKRKAAVEHFRETGELDESSNIQFGEGGAGTFSDGKLTTRIKDPNCRYVLDVFAKAGADPSILTKAKPHIGTDKLITAVKNIRKEIISLGGEVCFETPLDGFTIKNGMVRSVISRRGEEECSALVIACGHSAGSTFHMLDDKGIFMQAKPFSVGVRIEHKQAAVDLSLYGKQAGNPLLPKGEYQLSLRNGEGRGVYTFCMCPGGEVVAATSEKGGVVTNGMSEFARSGENANSAVVVSVTPDDFGHGVFDGFEFARTIEKKAYAAGSNYSAPACTVGGFLSGKATLDSASVTPTYGRGVFAYDLHRLFPDFVNGMLEDGLRAFARKMQCFGDMGAVLAAPETRTSSPIRIPRSENLTTAQADNLYPCGEGAGYAGGIMSAAADGLRIAEAIVSSE